MASSIISFNNKRVDVNDNFLLLGIYFIKINILKRKRPVWVNDYLENVIDEVLDIKPIGWGYMDLEENLTNNERKKIFIDILDDTRLGLKQRQKGKIDFNEVNEILNLEKSEEWNEQHFVEVDSILRFLDKIKALVDDNTSLEDDRLMKIRSFPRKH